MTTFCYFSSVKISSIVTGLFLTLVVWLYSGPSYSTPPLPPGKTVWFYRVDTRPPEIIFSEGFSPRGTNLNLVDHFLSMTDELRRTGFISVTDDYRTAVEFANNILGARNTDVVYIYQVSAEAGFYNVEYSIRAHLEDILFHRRESGDPLYNYLDRLYDGLDFFSWERGWVAPNIITGNSVRSMNIIRRNLYSNPEYGGMSISVDEQSVPNPGFTASNSLNN